MSEPPSAIQRVAVIGGGISGLAAANRLVELNPAVQVTLFEASARVGGVLQSEVADGFLIEHSADNFITNVPWGVDLCRRIGFAHELRETNAGKRQAFIVHRGRLCKVPEGFMLMAPSRLWPLLVSPLLSVAGKLRLAYEPFIRPRVGDADESLAAFARRRLGHEAFERIVQPLVGGIYTADAERLSMQAALPRFVQMERKHGSLLRGARAEAREKPALTRETSGARYSLFMAPAQGMSSLVERLASRLPPDTMRLDSPVESVSPMLDRGWQVTLAGDSPVEARTQLFDGVIVAAPAPAAGRMLRAVDGDLATNLGAIPLAGAAIVSVAYPLQQIAHPLDGFGFVVPQVERRQTLAASFSSVKYEGRAPAGHALIRVFLGGASRPDLIEEDESTLLRIVAQELGELLGVRGDPLLHRIVRWRSAMPQYHVGHCQLVERIEAIVARQPGLELAGNAYRGVGIPQCIHSGETAAERVLAHVQGATG